MSPNIKGLISLRRLHISREHLLLHHLVGELHLLYALVQVRNRLRRGARRVGVRVLSVHARLFVREEVAGNTFSRGGGWLLVALLLLVDLANGVVGQHPFALVVGELSFYDPVQVEVD